jgi:hypothetical protein
MFKIWQDYLTSEYEILKNINFSTIPQESMKYYLLYGKIQSGKTGNIISICHASQLNGYSNIIIIPNNSEGYLQFRDRIEEYNDFYERYIDDKERIEKFNLCFAGNTCKKNIRKLRSILSNDVKGTVLSLGNHTELQILADNLSSDSKYNLIIDEADTAYKKDCTSFRPLFNILLDKSTRVFGVSATTFKLWFVEDRILTTNILVINPSLHYKGIKDFSYHYIPKENRSPKRSEIAMENDDYFDDYIIRFKNKPLYSLENGELHPHIILYRSSEVLNEHHYQTQDHILINYPEITSIVFNGDGIRLYSPVFRDNDELVIYNESLDKDVCYFMSKKLQLKYILEYLRINGGADAYRCIVIISGKLANRMISFVSNSYRWHLTNMYLLTGKKPSCDDLLQMCRLCGVYKYDKIPLELAGTESICRDLVLADSIQDKLMKNAQRYAESLQEYIISKEIVKSELPRRKLVKGIKYKLNITIITGITDKSKLRVIVLEKLTGTIEKLLYNAFIEVLNNMENIDGGNGWCNKCEVINELVGKYEFAKSNDQVNGNLNSIIKNKTRELTNETNGVLLMKYGHSWLIKYRNI